jgi:hypothetical protein
MNKLASRKFWVSVVTAGVSTGLLVAGLITADIWKWAVSISVGAYLAAQGLTDAFEQMGKK